MKRYLTPLFLMFAVLATVVVVIGTAASASRTHKPSGIRKAKTLTCPVQPASTLQCSPCCDVARYTYDGCLRNEKSLCDCLLEAYDRCMNFAGGCGPCLCCEGWLEAYNERCTEARAKEK